MHFRQSLILSLSLMLLSTPAFAQTAQSEDTLAPQLLSQVEAYAQALLERDVATSVQLMSQHKQQRLQRKASPQAFSRYLEKDRANLLQALGNVDSVRGRFSVLSVERLEGAANLYLAFDGRALPKPITFLLENGTYRFDGGPIQAQSGSTYKIESKSNYSQQVGCIYNHWTQVGSKTTTYMYCEDEASICDNDGTRFTYKGYYHYCDFNTWGVDFYLFDGGGQCNDYCG
jgi:hypothetical protein